MYELDDEYQERFAKVSDRSLFEQVESYESVKTFTEKWVRPIIAALKSKSKKVDDALSEKPDTFSGAITSQIYLYYAYQFAMFERECEADNKQLFVNFRTASSQADLDKAGVKLSEYIKASKFYRDREKYTVALRKHLVDSGFGFKRS